MDAKLKSRESTRYHSNRVSSFKCDNLILACAIHSRRGVAFCVYRHTSHVPAVEVVAVDESKVSSTSSSSSFSCVQTQRERDKFRPWRDTHTPRALIM